MVSNLELYRTFYYVAELGSFTEAAKALFVTQSAVSQGIAKLEEELGTELFARSGKRTVLTPAGELLFGSVRPALNDLFHTENSIREAAKRTGRELHIGATETGIRFYLAEYLQKLGQEQPGVRLFLHGATNRELLELLKEDRVSLALMIDPLPDPFPWQKEAVGSFQDIVIAAAEDASLDPEHTYTPEELSLLPIISVSEDNSVYRFYEQWFLREGSLFLPQYTVGSMDLVLPLVMQGFGIGIVPDCYAQEALTQGKLREVKMRSLPERRSVYIVRK